MNPIWVTVLTFTATSLLVAAVVAVLNDAFFRYRASVNERLTELSTSGKTDGNASLFDLKQLHAQTSKTAKDWRSRLRDATEQAGLRVRISTLYTVSAGSGIVCVLAVAVFSPWWASPIGFALGGAMPLAFVLLLRRRRMRRLSRQLPEAFDVIARAVRAGQSVPAALQIVADELTAPLGDEFRRCCDQQNLGMSFESTLRDLARRTGVMELQILVVALLVQSRSGGNIVELLRNLSSMVRNRMKLQQKVKALTGEGRMQANVLIVLPVVAFACLLVLSPDYVDSLIQRPWLLAGTASAQVLGAVWMRRIVNVAA